MSKRSRQRFAQRIAARRVWPKHRTRQPCHCFDCEMEREYLRHLEDQLAEYYDMVREGIAAGNVMERYRYDD